MLKIKDNVDLKELEKFNVFQNQETKKYYATDCNGLYIDCETRKIRIDSQAWNVDFDILFEIIQAGLVEKVVEE